MKKFLALDMGDVWIGVAISDPLGITCRPLGTVQAGELVDHLSKLLVEHPVGTIVIGNPVTFSGGASEQTEKINLDTSNLKKQFAEKYPDLEWVLWDERLSSKRAAQTQQNSKKSKQHEHSVAAAFILQSYLDRRAF